MNNFKDVANTLVLGLEILVLQYWHHGIQHDTSTRQN